MARNLEGPDLKLAAALAQLHDVRAALRDVCADHGDSDWDDRLNLADVVNKHLRPYLEDRCRKAQGHGVRDVGASKP